MHLADPSDAELRDALAGDVDGVAVLLHDDMRALRYSLVVEHIRPGIRLFVAMFDGTARAQLERTVPNCVVLSPAVHRGAEHGGRGDRPGACRGRRRAYVAGPRAG